MQHKAIDKFKRTLGDVFVSAMDRIAGLKADDCAPAPFAEERAGLRWVTMVGGKSNRVGTIHNLNFSTQVHLSSLQHGSYARMSSLGCPVDCAHFFFAVRNIAFGES